jgi:hypothetical protein
MELAPDRVEAYQLHSVGVVAGRSGTRGDAQRQELGATMKTCIELTHSGRDLTIRALMIAGDWQIWFHENGHRIYLYAVVAGDQPAAIEETLRRACQDLEEKAIILPVVRFWPAPPGSARPIGDGQPRTLCERAPAAADSCGRNERATG